MKLKTLVIQRRIKMRTIKFREYVEHKRKDSPNFMNYEPEFNGNINEIFNDKLQSPGTKITYMQYTGVNDKNGKEIYEGDIIKYGGLDAENTFQYLFVTFDAEKAAFYAGSPSLQDLSVYGEVIGNKYENPELFTELLDRYQEKVKKAEDTLHAVIDIDIGDEALNNDLVITLLKIKQKASRLKELRKDSI